MDVFTFLNSINTNKENLYKKDPNVDKIYVPYVINNSMSYFLDTALYANFMNLNAHISKKMQYEYYLHTVRKGKRYSKWYKDNSDDTIEIIKQYYDCSQKKAREYSRILSKEQVDSLRKQLNTGGNVK